MAKTLLSIQDLRWRALAEMRKQPGARAFRASQSIENTSGWRFELALAAWHRTARWRAALLAIPPPLDLGPFAEIAPHGTREGLDEAGVLAAIPRRGGGGSGHQSGSRRRGRRQEGRGAVEALAMLFWNRQVGFPWSPE